MKRTSRHPMPSDRRFFALSFAVLFGAAVLFSNAGCGKSFDLGLKGSSGSVAVLDLDEVARLLGQDVHISQTLEADKRLLTGQVESLRSQLQQELETKKNAVGENPSQEDTQSVIAYARAANSQIDSATTAAAQELTRRRDAQVGAFRSSVRPVAASVAQMRGFTLVVPKNEAIYLSFDPSIDITQEVVRRLTVVPKSELATSVAPVFQDPVVSQRVVSTNATVSSDPTEHSTVQKNSAFQRPLERLPEAPVLQAVPSSTLSPAADARPTPTPRRDRTP